MGGMNTGNMGATGLGGGTGLTASDWENFLAKRKLMQQAGQPGNVNTFTQPTQPLTSSPAASAGSYNPATGAIGPAATGATAMTPGWKQPTIGTGTSTYTEPMQQLNTPLEGNPVGIANKYTTPAGIVATPPTNSYAPSVASLFAPSANPQANVNTYKKPTQPLNPAALETLGSPIAGEDWLTMMRKTQGDLSNLPYWQQGHQGADGNWMGPQMFDNNYGYAYDPNIKYTPPNIGGVAQPSPYTYNNWLNMTGYKNGTGI